jgi:DNA (cytosine-5)-methyltransferase 1
MLTLRGLGRVLGQLAEMGFDAEWGVFSAADIGARHIRERLWILAHTFENGHVSVCTEHNGTPRTRGNAPKWGTYRIFSEVGPSGSTLFGRKTHPDMVARMANDLAHRVDGIKATGNGQVPAVAALAWRILSEGLIYQT